MAERNAVAERRRDLPAMDRQARLRRTVAAVAAEGCDALVVTKPHNLRWLTGFTGSSGVAVLTADTLTVITDGRYRTQLQHQLDEAQVEAVQVIERDPSGPIAAAVDGAEKVALEAAHITWNRQREAAEWVAPATTVATVNLVEELRRVKEPAEIARLAEAAAIADEALAMVAPSLQPANGSGLTERAVARALEGALFDLGADGLSFPTIVASGPNSALPHARPSDRPIQPGDIVVIDFGASVDGYGSDMTRTFLIDPVPTPAQELFDAVYRAQAAGLAAVADGASEQNVDAACRDSLTEAGLGDAFVHGTGHGIGLEIHEDPIISARSSGILRSNQVVTVEPGAYLPELGGVRIEDSVVVTDDGYRAITGYPKHERISA